MSLLEQLLRSKDKLKATTTTVTRQDGHSYVFSAGECIKVNKKSQGYVVDYKPDNVPVEIVKHLYLGAQDCCEWDVLQNFKITCVLSIGIEAPCQYPNVTYRFIECLDLPETNIVTVLKNNCIEFIKDAIDNGINILVHCNAGVSRSATIIIGFLMLVYNLSYMTALSLVKSKRPCIKPNSGFEKQLKCIFK